MLYCKYRKEIKKMCVILLEAGLLVFQCMKINDLIGKIGNHEE